MYYLIFCLVMVSVFPAKADNAAERIFGLPPVPIPSTNPQSDAKIELGRALFFDKRLSADQSISCADCHRPEKGFSDGVPVARGINGSAGTRNTPTLLNAAYLTTLFHDGRSRDLEDQALGPLMNPVEHGLSSSQQLMQIVAADADYSEQFRKLFAVDRDALRPEHVAQALASYERTLVAGNSAFDRYYFGRDKSALSASAARGLRIFRRKGNCANCHEISWDHALFTDNRYYNIGVGFDPARAVVDELVATSSSAAGGQDVALTAAQRSALGRFNVTGRLDEIGQFKTPTLRNIALTAPYMHDGSLQTLAEVVDYYDKGGDQNRFLDPAIFPLHLSDQEKRDLVAFMQALTSAEMLPK